MLSFPVYRARKAAMPVVFVAVILMAVSGCSSSPRQNTTKSASTSAPASPDTATDSSVPPTSAAPAPIPDSSPLPGATNRDATVHLGPATVYSGCDPDYRAGDGVAIADGEVFNPATGHNVPIPKPAIPEGKKLVGVACTVGGGEDSIRVFYMITLLTPSSGLTPESYETQLVAFDPFGSDKPTATDSGRSVEASVEAVFKDSMKRLVPTEYGFMVLLAHNGYCVAGVDPNTLQKVFTDCNVAVPNPYVAINFDGYVTSTPDNSDHLVFHSARDGKELGNGSATYGVAAIDRHGFFVSRSSPSGYYYFDMKDAKFKGPLIGGGAGESGGTVWGQKYYYARVNNTFTVWDLSQNKSIFSLSGNDLTGLNPRHMNVAGKYLYINNDTDNPVIDLTDSQKASSGWAVRPTDVVSRDWMLVVHGRNPNVADCFGSDGTLGCSADQQPTLVHAPNGQYPGPWF